MLSIFKKLKDDKPSFEELNGLDKAVLISSLMIECAKSDDSFDKGEHELIKKIITQKLHLTNEEAEDCFNESSKISSDSVEIYSLTKDIRENFSKDEILIIFEYLWQIILVDKKIDDYEASMMTKLTGLFHLTGRENAQAKQNAESYLKDNI